MAGGSRRGPNKTVALYESDPAPIGDPIELDGLEISNPHGFAGVKFYADANGDTEATPTAGTATIEIKTLNTDPRWESFPDNVIQASGPRTVGWGANTTRVRATPDSINVATHWRLVVTLNEV